MRAWVMMSSERRRRWSEQNSCSPASNSCVLTAQCRTYVIEDICGHKMRRKGLYFYVKWEGWTRKNWEPESNLRYDAIRRAYDSSYADLHQRGRS
jgi:hypothetical protein